ncbi:hypothetical protein EB796_015397 [Bugula neritina]|uniref:PNPLA domain-containing protein n=1 Tax=Bugula neritina TaxID=10212 RepID=A0A7J7JIY7_BUGNE|nr:hypothetical protein EB796_015397 [Bugula neritina]
MGASWKKTSKDKRLPTKPPPLFNGVVDSSAAGRVGENGNKKSKIFSSNSSSSCFSKLPLADKKVTVDGSRRLLQNASSKALIELASTDLAVSVDELSTFTFPFENAVFEGGGVKGIAYVGAVKCLNDVGIRLKRFAGSSIGATVAGFLSVGYTADEMVALYLQDLSVFIRDSKCELLCFLPRLISKFGMNPGLAFLDWYGRCLAVKTQDPNITFKQVGDWACPNLITQSTHEL